MANRVSTKATMPSGKLIDIPKCTIKISGAGAGEIVLNNLPTITDTKSANYNPGAILGRAMPMMTYSYSDNRQIGMTLHMYIIQEFDAFKNLEILRLIQSAVYPQEGEGGAPYKPPPICSLKCGDLLATKEVCAILQSYNVTFPEDVAWHSDTYLPYRFDIQTQWIAVYTSAELPFQNDIIEAGY